VALTLVACGVEAHSGVTDGALLGLDTASTADVAGAAAEATATDAAQTNDTEPPFDAGPPPCEEGAACDDGDACTFDDLCSQGVCIPGAVTNCDDGNACTDDTCQLGLGCVHTATQLNCEDGNLCTQADPCVAGACKPGLPVSCDDGNVCTTDQCDATFGCVWLQNAATCTDANPCTESSQCQFGQCPPGKLKPCSDGLPCTYDVCDPLAGCEHLPSLAPTTCSDGEAYAGRCWKGLTTKANWRSARKACQAWGGELAHVRDKAENGWLRGLGDKVCGKGTPLWIGLNDMAREGLWQWSDDQPVTPWLFNAGEPNNSGDEDFVQMVADGRWNDLPGGVELNCALCERPLQAAVDELPFGWQADCAQSGEVQACKSSATCAGSVCSSGGTPASCDDGNPCTTDACTPGKGCQHTSVAGGSSCAPGGVCQAGVCQIGGSALAGPPTSCEAIKTQNPQLPSGVYPLDPDGAGPVPPYAAWCQMEKSAGWTLALKVDGASADASYDAPVWTDTAPSGTPLLDDKPGKTTAFGWMPVQQLAVALRFKGTWRWLNVGALPTGAAGQPLAKLFAGGKHAPSQLSVHAWRSLLPAASLQVNCLAQGVNVAVGGGAKVRIGIVGNNEDDCNSNDSWLGLGGANACGNGKVSAGNVACWYPDAYDGADAAFGYVFVR
jgi:hypothetical protein